MELSSLNEVRLIVLWQETNNFDEINNFFLNNYWNKIENFVELHFFSGIKHPPDALCCFKKTVCSWNTRHERHNGLAQYNSSDTYDSTDKQGTRRTHTHTHAQRCAQNTRTTQQSTGHRAQASHSIHTQDAYRTHKTLVKRCSTSFWWRLVMLWAFA